TFIYTFAETATSTSLQNLSTLQQQYRKAVHQMTELVVYNNCFYFLHFFRPWLHFDWIFSLTSKDRKQTKILKILHRFTEHLIITERRLYHKRTNGQYLKEFDNLSAQRDDNETIGTQRKRFSMLDLLIAESHKDLMTDIDIREEINAFVFAVSVAVSFILAQLAEHKNIQVFISLNINQKYDPDRFLPKKNPKTLIRICHSYAGPRNYISDCDIYKIFQRFDMLEMKTMIVSVIHNFYLEPIDYLKDVQLQTDITFCPTQQLRIRFISIHKINASN
ncbi:CP4C1 protein, partial [Acromyrmex insinuator]